MKKSRAAILPFAGDPFLLKYWLENFYDVWCDEVDRLYIVCDTCIEKPVLEYIEYLCTSDPDKITYLYSTEKGQHGDKILRGLLAATEKHVMLIEDDAYIFKKGMVNMCFEDLESGHYDIVGSKRGSCSFEILQRAADIWHIPYEGPGDQGCNFWPCYFFSTRQLLLQTDRNFNSRAWVQGDIITPLNDYVVAVAEVAGDTFVNTSLQLHAMVPEDRIKYVPQYHAHPDDLLHAETMAEYTPFDGRACWTHIGSLSSGISGAIKDDQNRAVERRKIDPPNGPTVLPQSWCADGSEDGKKEWERRVQFWLTYWERRDPNEIEDFAQVYKLGLDQLIAQFRLRPKQIQLRQKIYKERLNL